MCAFIADSPAMCKVFTESCFKFRWTEVQRITRLRQHFSQIACEPIIIFVTRKHATTNWDSSSGGAANHNDFVVESKAEETAAFLRCVSPYVWVAVILTSVNDGSIFSAVSGKQPHWWLFHERLTELMHFSQFSWNLRESEGQLFTKSTACIIKCLCI